MTLGDVSIRHTVLRSAIDRFDCTFVCGYIAINSNGECQVGAVAWFMFIAKVDVAIAGAIRQNENMNQCQIGQGGRQSAN